MASVFSPDLPDGAQADPRTKLLQEQERERAEDARTRATQDQLARETRFRSGRTGIRSLLGSFGSGNSLLGSG